MKPYQLIKDAHQVCEDLKYNLKYSKNRKRDIKRINTLLRALKSFDDILVQKYKTNEIDKLICFIIEDYLLRFEVENNYKGKLDLHSIVNKIKMCILDKNYNAISRLSGQITSYQISSNVINGIKEMPEKEDVNKLVKNLSLELKTDMKWTLKK